MAQTSGIPSATREIRPPFIGVKERAKFRLGEKILPEDVEIGSENPRAALALCTGGSSMNCRASDSVTALSGIPRREVRCCRIRFFLRVGVHKGLAVERCHISLPAYC